MMHHAGVLAKCDAQCTTVMYNHAGMPDYVPMSAWMCTVARDCISRRAGTYKR